MVSNRQQHGLKTNTLSNQRELLSVSFDGSKRFSNSFKKPLPLKVAAFFSGFISMRREVSGVPMNGSLTRGWCGRVSLISKSLSREGV